MICSSDCEGGGVDCDTNPSCTSTLNTATKPIDLAVVLQYRNKAVVARMAKDCTKKSKKGARRLFKNTLQFLWLAAKHGNLSPPPAIDKGWHVFILFMEDYESFCKRYFGRMIYHRPRRPEDKPDGGRARERSQKLAIEHLGKKVCGETNWGY